MQKTIDCVGGISLREVLPSGQIFGAADIRITSCCCDSRRCKEGDLFVALLGQEEDGHDYVQQAIDRGAVAVLIERPVPFNIPACTVEDTREAFGKVCQALTGNPSQQMHTIGITGTSGKTTTSVLLTSILEMAGHRVGMMGSLGYSDGLDTLPAKSSIPVVPEMASWLARMRANDCSHAVMELSSIGLATRKTAGIEFDAACITNVRRNRIDFHNSVLNYRRAKGNLLRQLRPHGFAVFNVDDPASKFLLSQVENPVLTIGMKGPAEVTAQVVERYPGEQTFLLTAGNETAPVRTRMIGDHHVYNCLAAAAIGLVYGIELAGIVRGLEAIECVPGRLERIECGQSFSVFVDSSLKPDSLVAGLRALREVTSGRLICVLGTGGDKNVDHRPLLGRAIERFADVGVLTAGSPGAEGPLAVIHDILDGYDRPSRALVKPDRAQAVVWALEQARAGDTVLIVGDNFPCQQLAGKHTTSDDRQIARHWLYESAKSHLNNPWTMAIARG